MTYDEFDKEFNDSEFKEWLKIRVLESEMRKMSNDYLQLLALAFNSGKILGRQYSLNLENVRNTVIRGLTSRCT